jgi:type I restriction enzyme R subunit
MNGSVGNLEKLEEGLNEKELAIVLLHKGNLGNGDRERVKQASQPLLASLKTLLRPVDRW